MVTKNPFTALDRAANDAKRRVATAIGEAALAWNKLQESFGYLFCAVAQARSDALAFAVWHSQVSDRAQREMIKAALPLLDEERQYLIEATDWLLKQANGLADERNHAIHAHFSLRIEDRKIEYRPDTWTGSRHAKALERKDPVAEFKEYSEWATRLSQYAIEIQARIRNPRDDSPLPETPQRRRVAHSQAKESRPRNTRKLPRHQP